MTDEGFFFHRVSELCRKAVATCSPDDDVLRAAALMREKNISGLVVCRDGEPVGVITDRDLRNRLGEIAAASGRIAASRLMSAPLVTIGESEFVFEAIYRMAKNRIHRLVVVDPVGRLVGILTDTDVIKLQVTTPLYFGRDIEDAESFEDLAEIHARVVEVVSYAFRTGARTDEVVRLISHFHDTITQRVFQLLLRDTDKAPTDRFSFLALGSEGRGEQTLKTDQDNAIVHADDLTDKEQAGLEAFSVRLIDSLVRIGVPPCPGGTMANRPQWRRSVSEWSRLLDQWISVPSPERMVNFGMFCDLRTVHGPPGYEQRLKQVILDAVGRNGLFLAYMARNILRFPPPLGLFGRLKVERSGPHKGEIDLKKSGIFAITEGVTLLALEVGILDGSTREKIDQLRERGALAVRDLDALAQAFDFLFYLRLRHQLNRLQRGEPPDNFIDPRGLSAVNMGRLKETLSAVEFFQRHIRQKFNLDLIPH